MPLGQADQPVARRFFRRYAGSGLVIQVLARFQPTPSRISAWRIVSSLTEPGGDPLGEGDLGGQGQRPERGRLAEVARAAVQQGAEPLARPASSISGRTDAGPVRLLPEAVDPLGGEGADGVADALRGAAEALGDLRGPKAVGAGEQDLAAAEGEGVGGAEAGPQGGPLRHRSGVGRRVAASSGRS